MHSFTSMSHSTCACAIIILVMTISIVIEMFCNTGYRKFKHKNNYSCMVVQLTHYNNNSPEFSMRHDRVSGKLARASDLLLFMIHSLCMARSVRSAI